MITIREILPPRQVMLDVASTTPDAAILEVAQTLRANDRVVNWVGLIDALKIGTSCVANENGYGIAIPHARTPHVSSMVMAAGRSRNGIFFPDAGVKVHYLFVIGVPAALASDYLRIIGALARTFRSPQSEAALREAGTAQEFVRLLSNNEVPT